MIDESELGRRSYHQGHPVIGQLDFWGFFFGVGEINLVELIQQWIKLL